MIGFGVKNLRRLDIDAPISIRPITILVGRNSIGKSTFLRCLPLLRQSVVRRTSSPILWYGDMVDFGDFDTSVYQKDINLPISFSFSFGEAKSSGPFFSSFSGRFYSEDRQYSNVRYNVEIVRKKSDEQIGTRISKIEFYEDIEKSNYSLHVSEAGVVNRILIDDEDVTSMLSEYRLSFLDSSLFPDLYVRPIKAETKQTSPLLRYGNAYEYVGQAIEKLFRAKVDKRTGDKTIKDFVGILIRNSATSKDAMQNSIKSTTNSSIKLLVAKILRGEEEEFYKKYRLFLLLHLMPKLHSVICETARRVMSSTLYIGPARSASSRYYRYQDLAVSEIDPDGKNFAMFLNSLPNRRMQEFSQWVRSLFGYGIKIGRGSGHITISLEYENETVNVIDTGYGISQILPVLGQIWWASTGLKNRSSETILVIEQPELHLHPAHQASLVDALIKGSERGDDPKVSRKTNFVVETHSETIINRIGHLISQGKISENDVQILIFEPDGDRTSVKTAIYDKEGLLSGWPYGFFLSE